MALNTSKCNHVTPLHFKGLMNGVGPVRSARITQSTIVTFLIIDVKINFYKYVFLTVFYFAQRKFVLKRYNLTNSSRLYGVELSIVSECVGFNVPLETQQVILETSF